MDRTRSSKLSSQLNCAMNHVFFEGLIHSSGPPFLHLKGGSLTCEGLVMESGLRRCLTDACHIGIRE